MTEQEFRRKYPHSTDEQVRLYAEAVLAEKQRARPPVEPDIPMPMITVPERVVPSVALTTCSMAAMGYVTRNFSLDDVPPEVEPADHAEEMREILLGQHGFKVTLPPEMRQRLLTTEMSENEMLAMLVGAPSASEFVNLA